MRNRKGNRIRCVHRYKGLYGNYVPRFRRMKENGKLYFVTDYQCQIKGCNHWKLAHFKHLLPKRKTKRNV